MDKANAINRKDFRIILPGIIGIVLSGFISVLLFAEFVRIKLIANPEVIARYYFGSEAMMGHGGWMYKLASLYAWYALAEGLVIFGIGLLFPFAIARGNKKYLVIGYLSIAAWFTYVVLSYL